MKKKKSLKKYLKPKRLLNLLEQADMLLDITKALKPNLSKIKFSFVNGAPGMSPKRRPSYKILSDLIKISKYQQY